MQISARQVSWNPAQHHRCQITFLWKEIGAFANIGKEAPFSEFTSGAFNFANVIFMNGDQYLRFCRVRIICSWKKCQKYFHKMYKSMFKIKTQNRL